MGAPVARNRRTRGTQRLEWGVSLQDQTPLEVKVAEIAGGVVDAALEAPLEELEEISETLEAAGLVVRSADVELPGGYAGQVYLEGFSFSEAEIGAPVIVTQSGDVEELALIVFAGAVVDSRRIKVRYISSSPAPRRTRVNFIIGVRGSQS